MIKDILTKFLGNIMSIVLALFVIFFLVDHCKRDPCPGKGEVIVSQSFLDSLKKIAEMPPSIIIRDTIIYKDTTIYLEKPVPQPYYTDYPINKYRDSLQNADIRVWVDLKVKGYLEHWGWQYQPVFRFQTKETYIPQPYPVGYEVEKPFTGFIGQVGAGGGERLALSVEMGHINKRGRIIGGQYIRYGDKGFVLMKYGIKF